MRNKFRLFILIIFILIIIGSLSACRKAEQLETPAGLSIDGNTLSWDAVPNALKYSIRIQDAEYISNVNSYHIIVDDYNEYAVSVKAIGDGKNFIDSEYSEIIIYKKAEEPKPQELPRLSAPSGIKVSEGFMTWNAVINAVGYRVRIIDPDNKTITEDVTARHFTLIGNIDGLYSISVMALANTQTHRHSLYSPPSTYRISGGKIHLYTLRAPSQVTFSGGRLRWSNVANASGYVINIDGADVYTISEGSINSYDLGLTDAGRHAVKVKTLGDGVNYNDSDYSVSISFPLAITTPPRDLKLVNGVLTWEENPDAAGYLVLHNNINVSELIEGESFQLSFDTPDFHIEGLNTLRVKAVGDNIYYTDSPYSMEIGYMVKDNQPVPIPLPSPKNLTINDGFLEWTPVDLAISYIVEVDNSGTIPVDTNGADISFLADGVHTVSVKAIGDNIYSEDSPYSEQLFYISGSYSGPVLLEAPKNIRFDAGMVVWDSVLNATAYDVVINGITEANHQETYLGSNYFTDDGVYTIKVKAKGDNLNYADSPYSEEFMFVKPQMLDTPQEVYLTDKMLNWSTVDNATGYYIEIKDASSVWFAESMTNSYTLELESDGTYYLRVRAVSSSGFYSDSYFSYEVIYQKLENEFGSEENPYLIQYTEDLDLVRYFPSAYFLLARNLDLSEVEFEPLCTYSAPFSGHFDGNGHKISNIFITGSDSFAGFFGYINGGTVVNLNLENITINIDNYAGEDEEAGIVYAGGMAGYGRNVTITGCSIGNITIDIKSNLIYAGLFAGSLTGSLEDIDISGSLDATSNGNIYAGGLSGTFEGSLTNVDIGISEQSGIVIDTTATADVGGIAGRILNGALDDVNADAVITVEIPSGYVGGVAGLAEDSVLINMLIDTVIEITAEEIISCGGMGGVLTDCEIENVTINVTIASSGGDTAYIGGISGEVSGSAADGAAVIYDIEVAAHIVYAGGFAGYGGMDVVNSSLDGALNVDAEGDTYAGGLFGKINGALDEISSKTHINISGQGNIVYAGGVAGAYNGDIIDCEAEIELTINAPGEIYAGGLTGEHINGDVTSVKITLFKLNAQSDGEMYLGGVTGAYSSGALSGAEVYAQINASAVAGITAGGVCGMSSAEINEIEGNINITADSDNDTVIIGGVSGVQNAVIQDAAIIGNINAGGAGVIAGGIAGISLDISNVSFNGGISGNTTAYTPDETGEPEDPEELDETLNRINVFIGGICGYINGSVTDAQAIIDTITASSVSGNAYAGGIAGKQLFGTNTGLSVQGTDVNSEINADAFMSSYAGGITGESGGIFEGVYEDGELVLLSAISDITVKSYGRTAYAGGLAGLFKNQADSVSTSGMILADSEELEAYSGGICGYSDGASAENARSLASVSSKSPLRAYSGGICAFLNSSVISDGNYSGTLNAESDTVYAGGIAAYIDDGTVSDSYSMGEYFISNSPVYYLGGVAGYLHEGLINRCYSIFNYNSSVKGIENDIETYIGGLIGQINAGNVTNSYSVSNISLTDVADDDYIGGFTGKNVVGEVTFCYVTGKISIQSDLLDAPFVGNFMGVNTSELNKCKYDDLMLSPFDGIGNGSFDGLDILAMGANCTAEFFEGWDVENVWIIDDYAYPRLRGLDGQDYIAGVQMNKTMLTISPDDTEFDLNNLISYTFDGAAIFKGAYYTVLPQDPENPDEINPYLSVTPDGKVAIYLNTPTDEYTQVSIKFEGNIELLIDIQIINVEEISGSGTQEDPYKISSAFWMNYLNLNPRAYFELTNDIDLSGEPWTPVGKEYPFSGGLDGNGHKIIGLNNYITEQYGGLFANISGAKINNLALEDISVNISTPYGNVYAGGVAAYAVDSEISNITISGQISVIAERGDVYAGSVAGYAVNTVIGGCNSYADISAEANLSLLKAGGIAGYLSGSIEKSFYNADIGVYAEYGVIYSGGLIGHGQGLNIEECYAAGDMNINTLYAYLRAGGLAGEMSAVYGETYTGSYITDCYAGFAIRITAEMASGYTGGLVGDNQAYVSRCYSASMLIEGKEKGLFSGYNLYAAEDCYYLKNDYYNSTGIMSGNSDGITGVSADFLMSGSAISDWDKWDFVAGRFPRLTDLTGQDFVADVDIEASFNINNPGSMININDYIVYDTDSIFTGFTVSASSTTVLSFVDSSFAFVMGDGQVTLTLTFDGGHTEVITVNVSGAGEPLFAEGAGTEDNPFIIYSLNEFNNIKEYKNFYYKLGAEIDLTGIEWTSFGTYEAPFMGGFDGDTFAINNLSGESLFGYLDGAKISNITLNNANVAINTGVYAGILAVQAKNSEIIDCEIDEFSSLTTNDPSYYGGFIGNIEYSIIKGLEFKADIDVEAGQDLYIGSITASAYYSFIETSLMSGLISVDADGYKVYAGAISGYAYKTEFKDINHTVAITLINDQGLLYAGGISGYAFDCVLDNITADVDFIADYTSGIGILYLGGLIAEATDTVVDTASVTSGNTLIDISDAIIYGGVIATNISANEIRNISLDLTIDIESSDNITAGGVIGNDYGYIEGVQGSFECESASGQNTAVGGIAGFMKGSVINADIEVNINAYATGLVLAGGIAGDSNGEIESSAVSGVIISNTAAGSVYAGGIAGYNFGKIIAGESLADISAYVDIGVGTEVEFEKQNVYIGGIAGYNESNIDGSSNLGEIYLSYAVYGSIDTTSNSQIFAAGGIAGISKQSITNAYSDCEIYADVLISPTASYITGNPEKTAYVGGIAGNNSAHIGDSYALDLIVADIDGADLYIGGAIGYNSGVDERGLVISNYSASNVYYNCDTVNYDCFAGGFVGRAYGELIIGAEYDLNMDSEDPEIEPEIVYYDIFAGLIVACYYDTDVIEVTLPGYETYDIPQDFSEDCPAILIVQSSGKTTAELTDDATYPETVIYLINPYDESHQPLDSIDMEIVTWDRTIWQIIDNFYPEFIS